MSRKEAQTATENVQENKMVKTEVTSEVIKSVEIILRFYGEEVSQILFDLNSISILIQTQAVPLSLLGDLVEMKISKMNQLGEAQIKYNNAFDILSVMKFEELEGLSC